MLGWEFPPFISGGLGTACYGLTQAMSRLGVQITLVLPKAGPIRFGPGPEPLSGPDPTAQKIKGFENVEFRRIVSALRPYSPMTVAEPGHLDAGIQLGQAKTKPRYESRYNWQAGGFGHYDGDLYSEVQRYARAAVGIAQAEDFDIIHAHDWMTYPAAIAVAEQMGKPLVAHIHSTEFDRSGEHVNQMVYEIERQGMHAADKVIAVSNYTKNIVVNRYGLAGEKVQVVYNGVQAQPGEQETHAQAQSAGCLTAQDKADKIVLFLGRITMQKGPEYFIRAAKKVLEKMDNVKFVMAGDGDLLYPSVQLAAESGVGHKVLFTWFLPPDQVHKAYRMADVYVMPSVSEPFGIAPLEALQHNVPVIISKQSGIAEVLTHALKVDFWDVHELANKIIAVLTYAPLHATLRQNGHNEASKFRWEDSAARIHKIYGEILSQAY